MGRAAAHGTPASQAHWPRMSPQCNPVRAFLMLGLAIGTVRLAVQLNGRVWARERAPPGSGPIRLVCMFPLGGMSPKLDTILQTWVTQCDEALLCVENATDVPASAHVRVLAMPKASWGYDKLFVKVSDCFDALGASLPMPADRTNWVLKADQDTFVDVPRLREYLRTLSRGPHFLGRRFKYPFYSPPIMFNSGGAGYLLDEEALGVFLRRDKVRRSECRVDSTHMEDLGVAACLRKYDVLAGDTRDTSGRERFHPFSRAVLREIRRGNENFAWYWSHSVDGQDREGEDVISRETCTFHNLTVDELRALWRGQADGATAEAAVTVPPAVVPNS